MKAPRKPIPTGKRWRFRLEAAVLRALAWLVPKFPRRAVTATGGALGRLTYHLAPGLRRIALANLNAVFADTKSLAEKHHITRASLQNVGRTLLGLFWSPRLTTANLPQLAEVDEASLEMVRRVHARGRGLIFVTLHYGDWELLGLATGFYGIPVTIVQEAEQNVAIEEIFGWLRGRSGHRLVPGKSAAPALLKALKRGQCIAMLVDLSASRKHGGIWLEFFGLPVYSPSAAGALALRTGAAIIPSVAHPLPDGRMRIVYGSEITHTASGDYETDVRAINQQCLTFCEQTIRAAPEHWMWTYKRWTPRVTPEQGRYPAYSRYWPDLAP